MKKLPIWLNYGLITSIPLAIFGMLLFLPIPFNWDSLPRPLAGVVSFLAIIIYVAIRLVLLPFEGLGDSFPFDLIGCCGEVPMPTMAGMVISLIIWFLIGALIGYTIQRNKKDKVKSSSHQNA